MVNTSYRSFVTPRNSDHITRLQHALIGTLPDTWVRVSTPRVSILPWFSIPDGYDDTHVTSSVTQDAEPLSDSDFEVCGLDWAPANSPTCIYLSCRIPSLTAVRDAQIHTITEGFNGSVLTEPAHPRIPLCRAEPQCNTFRTRDADDLTTDEVFGAAITPERAAGTITAVNGDFNTTFTTTGLHPGVERLVDDIDAAITRIRDQPR